MRNHAQLLGYDPVFLYIPLNFLLNRGEVQYYKVIHDWVSAVWCSNTNLFTSLHFPPPLSPIFLLPQSCLYNRHIFSFLHTLVYNMNNERVWYISFIPPLNTSFFLQGVWLLSSTFVIIFLLLHPTEGQFSCSLISVTFGHLYSPIMFPYVLHMRAIILCLSLSFWLSLLHSVW